MMPPRPVWVHPSLSLEAIRDRRRDALEQQTIPGEFHYLGAWQSQLWLEVHREHAPVAQDSSFQDLYAELYAHCLPSLPDSPLHLVALGCGAGSKDYWLAEALREQDRTRALQITPVDVSVSLAMSSRDLLQPLASAPIRPLAADLFSLTGFSSYLETYDEGHPRIFTLFGVLPNLPGLPLLRLIRSWMRPQDHLLISANLAPMEAGNLSKSSYRKSCEQILPQYDNEATRRWLERILIEWGWREHLDDLTVRIESIGEYLGPVVSTTWRQDTSLVWEGTELDVAEGTPLQVFYSIRYTEERLHDLLAQAGLAPRFSHLTSCREEGVWEACIA